MGGGGGEQDIVLVFYMELGLNDFDEGISITRAIGKGGS
jgi:hypothetical protein